MRESVVFAPELVMMTLVRVLLGGMLLYSAWGKLLDLRQFRYGVAAYRLLPAAFVTIVSATIPPLELLLAIGLLSGIFLSLVAFVTAVLLLMFSVAVSVNLRRGREIACACTGSATDKRISWGLIGRNLLLVIAALWLGTTTQAQSWTGLWVETLAMLTNISVLMVFVTAMSSIILILQLIEHSITLWFHISNHEKRSI